MNITRYEIRDEDLRPWLNFIWHFRQEDAEFSSQLLPTDTVDVIINLGAPVVYETETLSITAPAIHINGLRNTFYNVRQQGDVEVYGIACKPWGLRPFVDIPLNLLSDGVFDLRGVAPKLAEDLRRTVASPQRAVADSAKSNWTETTGLGEPPVSVRQIEAVLSSKAAISQKQIEEMKLLAEFLEQAGPDARTAAGAETAAIGRYCQQKGISVKTFARVCRRYTGYPPSTLRKLHRFQAAGNELVHGRHSSLASSACCDGFADQAHFIREFKALTGAAPTQFLKEKRSVKQTASYSYEKPDHG